MLKSIAVFETCLWYLRQPEALGVKSSTYVGAFSLTFHLEAKYPGYSKYSLMDQLIFLIYTEIHT